MGKKRKNNYYILTGAPGVGKTSLVDALSFEYRTVREPAREVIFEQSRIDGNAVWEEDRNLFLDKLLSKSIDNFNNESDALVTFFDRGIPDTVAYSVFGGITENRFLESSLRLLYNRKVFLLSPWEQIYKTDDERQMSFSDSLKFHDEIVRAYDTLDYELILVPNASIAKRVQFIKDQID